MERISLCVSGHLLWPGTWRYDRPASHWPLVMLRYIENIEISIRCPYIVSYRIACGNIEIFDIPVSTFWYIILPNFHVWCQGRKIFIETFIETFTVSESFNENFTSWHHTWKFGKRITNFSLWENPVKFYITTYFSEFQKAVISRRGPCLSSMC